MEMMKINVVDSGHNSNKDCDVSMGKHGRLTITLRAIERLKLEEGHQILVGNVGDHWYLCRKPEGYFGYTLRKHSEAARFLTATSTNLRQIPQGKYEFGNPYTDENGITWYPLQRQDLLKARNDYPHN